MGLPQKIMRAHCAVIRPDHFKFASYGPGKEAIVIIFLLYSGYTNNQTKDK